MCSRKAGLIFIKGGRYFGCCWNLVPPIRIITELSPWLSQQLLLLTVPADRPLFSTQIPPSHPEGWQRVLPFPQEVCLFLSRGWKILLCTLKCLNLWVIHWQTSRGDAGSVRWKVEVRIKLFSNYDTAANTLLLREVTGFPVTTTLLLALMRLSNQLEDDFFLPDGALNIIADFSVSTYCTLLWHSVFPFKKLQPNIRVCAGWDCLSVMSVSLTLHNSSLHF